MCGIAGVVHTDRGYAVDRRLLDRMTATMAHRGPDGEAVRWWPGAGLGHRRLSIIDLVTGDQPITGEDGRRAVVLNGEIYNFRELRTDLTARGHAFATGSDTEAIVHAYEEHGVDCVTHLRGMFALAVWDDRNRRLLLARDRVGKKPLFYHHDGERLIFASEIKALLQDPGVKRELCAEALVDYFAFGRVPAPATMFRGIHALPPAHRLVWECGRIRVDEYWDVPVNPRPRREDDALEEFQALLDAAVRERLVADVPLGAFLSGGVDSSVVVASMARQSDRPVRTTAVGFIERSHSELPYASQVAQAVGADHEELIVRPRAVDDLPRLVWYMDQPLGDASAVPTYYVSRAARERVTVALSGDGGDELFAGYSRRYGMNRLEDRLRRWIPPGIRRHVLAPVGRRYPRSSRIPRPLRAGLVLRNLGDDFERAYGEDLSLFRSEERTELLSPELLDHVSHRDPVDAVVRYFERVRHADPLSRVLYVDFKTWLADDILVKVDRMSMACSLEVRSPLLDHRIVEFAARLPPNLKLRGRTSKYLLKRHLERYVPHALVHRRKQGFELPVARWLRTDLRELVEELLFSSRAVGRGTLRSEHLRRMWEAHRSGARDHGAQLWALMVLELWLRVCVERP